MTTDLFPCPFCGSREVRRHTRPDGLFSWVYCGPCGAQGPVEEGRPDESTPEERWNRRAQSAEQRAEKAGAEVERLTAHHDDTIRNYEKQIDHLEAERDGLREALEAAEKRAEAAEGENERLKAALRSVKRTLLIPAAEYVPAIPDAWDIIDGALR